METFNPGWTFILAYQVEILARLNSKLLFKMTFQLHVKILARCTELKFQFGVTNWKKKNVVMWKITKPQGNRKFNKSSKAKPGAWQKQIKTKMAAVNKKLKFVILQQVNVISILLLQIIAASEYYQYSRFLHITFKFL